MKTQQFVVMMLTIFCIGALLFSATSWKKKISVTGTSASSAEESLLDGDQPFKTGQVAEKISVEAIHRLGTSLDEKTLNVLLSRQESNEIVQMLVVGSEAMAAVGENFGDAIGKAYSGFIETDIATFDMTSARFMEDGLESNAIDWAKGYDIVLYEPFTWKNNGNVVIEQEHQHLLAVKQLAESHVADVSFLVTPPQPIYRAGYYLTQIQALKKFTAARDIPFIDHWDNWPDTQSEELLNFIDEYRKPTEAGIAAWSDALTRYFMGHTE